MQHCNSDLFLQNYSDPHNSPFKSCSSMWSLTESPSPATTFSVPCLFFCSYCMMQSCWALDSRKRPSFSCLASSLACQLAEAEGAVSKHSEKSTWTMSGLGFGVLWSLHVAPQITMSWGRDSCFLLKYTTLLWIHCPWIHIRAWAIFFCHHKKTWSFWWVFSSSYCLHWDSGKLKSLSLCWGDRFLLCSSQCSQLWWCW